MFNQWLEMITWSLVQKPAQDLPFLASLFYKASLTFDSKSADEHKCINPWAPVLQDIPIIQYLKKTKQQMMFLDFWSTYWAPEKSSEIPSHHFKSL